jgi:cold shock CspA family protein
VNNWQPGSTYGFIAADDGQTWFAPIWETQDRARLEPGSPVTFTGDPSPPPGKTCPAATDIIAGR